MVNLAMTCDLICSEKISYKFLKVQIFDMIVLREQDLQELPLSAL